MFVFGDDVEDGYDLVLIFFNDDGLSLLYVMFNLKEDLVIFLYFSGISGFLKCVMVIYYNLVVLGCIVIVYGFMDFK